MPVLETGGGIDVSVLFVPVDNISPFASLSCDGCCDSDLGASGGGRDARKTFNEGSETAGRFTRRCSFSSPGTSGRPEDAASLFH